MDKEIYEKIGHMAADIDNLKQGQAHLIKEVRNLNAWKIKVVTISTVCSTVIAFIFAKLT